MSDSVDNRKRPWSDDEALKWKSEYEQALKKMGILEEKHENIQQQYQELQIHHEDLQKKYDEQVESNAQFRNTVDLLKDGIAKMKSTNEAHLKTISDLQAKRKADQTKIAHLEAGHKENDNEKALEVQIANSGHSNSATQRANADHTPANPNETRVGNPGSGPRRISSNDNNSPDLSIPNGEQPTSSTAALAITPGRNQRKRQYPDWMTQVSIQRFPYIPQLGDRVVYFPLGHKYYLDDCKKSKVYVPERRDYPTRDLKCQEYAKIQKLEYRFTPYHCVLLWLRLESGKIIKIFFHELGGTEDFIIPRSLYERSIQHVFNGGDQIEGLIDGKWWTGTVQGSELNHNGYTHCYFNSIEVKWDDNEELVDCSPWDIQPLTLGRSCGVAATWEEIKEFGFIPVRIDDWEMPSGAAINVGNDAELARSHHLNKLNFAILHLIDVQDLSIFRQPVDTIAYPEYLSLVFYPIDLQTIRQRAINKFYRTLVHLKLDIQLIASNAIKYNGKDSEITVASMRLVETLFHVIDNANPVDAVQYFESLFDKSSIELTAYQMEICDPNIALEEESSTQFANGTQGGKLRSAAAKARESWNIETIRETHFDDSSSETTSSSSDGSSDSDETSDGEESDI